MIVKGVEAKPLVPGTLTHRVPDCVEHVTVPGPPEICIVNPSSWPIMKLLSPAVKYIEPVSWTSVLSRLLPAVKPFCRLVNVGLFRNAPTLYPAVAGHPGSPPGTEQK